MTTNQTIDGVSRKSLEQALKLAVVFDDGGDGADAESARGVVWILRALLDAESAPCAKSQVEGKREHFQKWVMATKHPVYGFLDGRSLARGDDRTGYADEYVQGLWVAYLAFGAEQLAPVPVVPELTSELRWILGQMCFQHIHTAQALRSMGHQIARKAEDEQAVTIYWMLGHYLKDPENWRENATAEMKAAAPAA